MPPLLRQVRGQAHILRDSSASVSSNMAVAANRQAEAGVTRAPCSTPRWNDEVRMAKKKNRKNRLLWLLLENASSAYQATSSQ